MRRALVPAVAAAMVVSACTTDPYTGEQKVSNTAIGAGIGALAGAAGGALIGGRDKRTAALIGAGVGALAGGAVGAYMDNQEAQLRARLQNSGVSVTRVGDSIVLNMPSNITFDTDQAAIKPQFFEVLSSVAIVLNEFNKSLVDVYGHTDSDGPDQYNLDLSNQRANSVAQYLISQGVSPRRIEAVGFGETQPIASNSTPQGKQQNRRVEIRIVPLQQA